MRLLMGSIMVGMDDKPICDKVPSGEKNLMGQDILVDGPPFTLRTVCQNALVAVYQDEQQLSGEDKLSRWELAVKIKKAVDPCELTTEEVVLVKKLIGKAYGPVISGQAWEMLESGITLNS